MKLNNMINQPTLDLVEYALIWALSPEELGTILNKNSDKIKAILVEPKIAYNSLDLALEKMDALIASDNDYHKVVDQMKIVEETAHLILKL